ncbi:MAG: TIGR02757 family protein [Fretibacterium sp.]|nr:TIGR02757 family protein [Fretibacterium sp.]
MREGSRLDRMRAFLDGLYYVYNRKELVDPDPLIFLYRYEDPADREVAGLLASCLAYGRVAQILKSVDRVLDVLGTKPSRTLKESGAPPLPDFRHRFTASEDVSRLIRNLARLLRRHGSLEVFLKRAWQEKGGLLPALDALSAELEPERTGFPLIPAPGDGSACKRLFLFLKWMTRRDDVDPGGWTFISPRDLIMPTDTHIHSLALGLGLTRRKVADLTTALEITRAFSCISPEDPTRYDFVLTRFGIRSGLDAKGLPSLLD